MAGEFQVAGKNKAALFTLKLHRSDGMALVAMNWKTGKPPRKPGETTWWAEDNVIARKIRDRELFA